MSNVTSPSRKSFMLFFRNSGPDTYAHLPPEEKQAYLSKWNEWYDSLAKEGKAVEGSPLVLNTRLVSGAGGARVIDGPFVEGKEIVGGYVKLLAGSLDEATQAARRHPGLEHGMIIEVREFVDACELGMAARGRPR